MGLVRLRQAIIVLFCGFHFLSIAWWVFPNSYTDFVLEQASNGSFAARFEERFFLWHQTNNQTPLFQLFRKYIDLIGAYQYWDFFAPDSPATIHYLSVCNDIDWDPARRRIDCAGDILYKSYDGSLEDAIRSFDGNRSRSFRFAENLVRFDSDAHDRFNAFWTHKVVGRGVAETVYLIDYQFQLKTDYREKAVAATRSDFFLSVLSRPEPNKYD